jgi:ABC-type nitrate/sulfonate/bicarbonate transport system permease component
MESQSISLFDAIFSTTIWTIVWLVISSVMGAGLGWLLGQNARLAAVSQRVLQFLTCWAVISASKVFCLLLVITIFTTMGVQKAKQAGNQWQLMIVNIFLGMRLGLILFWVLTQYSLDMISPGLGNYIYNAHSNMHTESLLMPMFSILILVILFDQALNFLENFLMNRFMESPRRIL